MSLGSPNLAARGICVPYGINTFFVSDVGNSLYATKTLPLSYVERWAERRSMEDRQLLYSGKKNLLGPGQLGLCLVVLVCLR